MKKLQMLGHKRKVLPRLDKMKKDEHLVLDEYYDFKIDIGYIPTGHLTIEDEIRDICKEQRIYVHKIREFKVFQVTGKKIKNKKKYERFINLLIK